MVAVLVVLLLALVLCSGTAFGAVAVKSYFVRHGDSAEFFVSPRVVFVSAPNIEAVIAGIFGS